MTQIARRRDYRDEIALLIQERFGTRRKFAEASSLSVEEVSDLLEKRATVAPSTLAEALARIGYALHVAPVAEVKQRRPIQQA